MKKATWHPPAASAYAKQETAADGRRCEHGADDKANAGGKKLK